MAAILMVNGVSAYIDPGTGGAIIGSAWPILAGAIALIGAFLGRYLIVPIKKILKKQ